MNTYHEAVYRLLYVLIIQSLSETYTRARGMLQEVTK